MRNVLFLCTGNSARSILAEAILNKAGQGKFRAFSAGSRPKGTSASKCGRPFAKPGLRHFRPAFQVLGGIRSARRARVRLHHYRLRQRRRRDCPIWPGKPITAHWGIPDPAAARGTPADVARAFDDAYGRLFRRIALFLMLPHATVDQSVLKPKLTEIGRTEGE
jgi:arsenate reductase